MKKQSWIVSLLLCGLALLLVSRYHPGVARMVICDVGQGDAILIVKGRNQALIDGGPSSEKILSCLEKELPFWDRTIELIVLTNTDSDHMEGLSSVVDRYKVMQFVTADGVHPSSSLDKIVDILARNKVQVKGVELGDRIQIRDRLGLDRLEFSVLWPPGTKGENVAVFGDQMDKPKREQILEESAKEGNLNERSVVLYLLEDNTSVLLMGDAGDQTEKVLVEEGGIRKIDILKVGHHGSKYASTTEFLEMIEPKLAVISVGEKNRYGHPTPETLERLGKVGAKIRRTDQEGTIVLPLSR